MASKPESSLVNARTPRELSNQDVHDIKKNIGSNLSPEEIERLVSDLKSFPEAADDFLLGIARPAQVRLCSALEFQISDGSWRPIERDQDLSAWLGSGGWRLRSLEKYIDELRWPYTPSSLIDFLEDGLTIKMWADTHFRISYGLIAQYKSCNDLIAHVAESPAYTRMERESNLEAYKVEKFRLLSEMKMLDDRNNRPIKPQYSERDKSLRESAAEFLMAYYTDDLLVGMTLSELRLKDAGLWRALRNWAHHGGYDLDAIIPRGKTNPGPAREEFGFDPAQLDPNDPIQAAALKLVRKREADRQSAARGHRARKHITPKP